MQNELNNILNKLREMPDKMYLAQMQVVIKSNLLREQDLDIRTYQRKQIQAIAEEKTVEGKKKFSNQQARDAELEFRTLQDKNKIMQMISETRKEIEEHKSDIESLHFDMRVYKLQVDVIKMLQEAQNGSR